MTRLDLTPFYRSAIGFDRMANLVDSLFQTADSSQSNWPPYNIEKIGDADYRITMAVAGFAEADLEITTHEQMLIVRGQTGAEADEEGRLSSIAELPGASLNGASSWQILSASPAPA